MKYILFTFGILLGISRIFVGHEASLFLNLYKDTAHIYIGGLGTAWYIQREKWQLNLFWVLNIVEVAMAIISRL